MRIQFLDQLQHVTFRLKAQAGGNGQFFSRKIVNDREFFYRQQPADGIGPSAAPGDHLHLVAVLRYDQHIFDRKSHGVPPFMLYFDGRQPVPCLFPAGRIVRAVPSRTGGVAPFRYTYYTPYVPAAQFIHFYSSLQPIDLHILFVIMFLDNNRRRFDRPA